MSDHERLTRSTQESRNSEQSSDDPSYLPRSYDAAGAIGAGRFDRVREEREAAASQIARTVKVWRKGSGAARQTSIPEGGGDPMPSSLRARMEPQLGADLSGVKLHTGGASASAAKDLNARAFTVGNDVHFNSGEFAPGSKEGNRLLAHELTHVVQGQQSGIQRKAEGEEEKVSTPEEPAEKEADAVADKVADSMEGEGGEKGEKGGKADEKGAKGKGGKKAGDHEDAKAGPEAKGEGEGEAAEAKAPEAPAEAAPEVGAKIFRKPAKAAAPAAAGGKDPKKTELDKKKDLLKKRVELAAKDAEVVQNAVKIVTSAVTDAVALITGPLAGLATQGVIKNIMGILTGGANLAVSVRRDMQAAVMNKAIENMSAEQIDAKIAAWNKDEPTFSDMKSQIDAAIAQANEECSLVDQDIAATKAKGAVSGAKEGTKNKALNAGGKAVAVGMTGKAIVDLAKAAAGEAAKEQIKTGVFGFIKKVMDAVPVLGTAISIGVCVKSCIDAASIRKEVEALEKELGVGKK